MQFLVITDAPTLIEKGRLCAYAPYVVEMDIWFKHIENVTVVSPTHYNGSLLALPFVFQPKKVVSLHALNFSSFLSSLKSVLYMPVVGFKIFREIYQADHIHLRCPGNIGLLGCLVQIFFPKKTKTAKYAGNWDPKAKQPLSYRLQKWILSNTVLTQNMSVLVYGKWPNQTQNIKSFFTATFKKNEVEPIESRDYSGDLQFVFVGTLVEGKRPLLAIQMVESLHQKGGGVRLDIYGDGVLRTELEDYVESKNLSHFVQFHGNQQKQKVKNVLKRAHFLILPSKSEGWPKAIAEAMFFGAIPIATPISCVPYMLGFGKRGILVEPYLDKALAEIERHLNDTESLKQMSQDAANWSQNYTLEGFETEIVKLLRA